MDESQKTPVPKKLAPEEALVQPNSPQASAQAAGSLAKVRVPEGVPDGSGVIEQGGALYDVRGGVMEVPAAEVAALLKRGFAVFKGA